MHNIKIVLSRSFNPYRVFEYVATLVLDDSYRWRVFSFNPYRVFEYVATSLRLVHCDQWTCVSIPIGFSSTLQPGYRIWKRNSWNCFNPYRVFEYVATSPTVNRNNPKKMFQSLSGFRVRCNHISFNIISDNHYVSIPIGFSSTLQLPFNKHLVSHFIRFNPYRVFEYVATEVRVPLFLWEVRFNPYRVFEYVATIVHMLKNFYV